MTHLLARKPNIAATKRFRVTESNISHISRNLTLSLTSKLLGILLQAVNANI